MFKASQSLGPVSGIKEAPKEDKVIAWKAKIRLASVSISSVQSGQAWAQVVRYFSTKNCMFEPYQ